MASRPQGYRYVAFLAHSSDDKKFVEQICVRLESEYRLHCFYDADSITPGQDFDKRIPKAVDESAFGLFFYGTKKLGEYFREEIGMWKHEAQRRGQGPDAQEPVSYVLLPNAPAEEDGVKLLVNDYLRRCNRIDLRKDLFDPVEFGKLVRLLQMAAIRHSGAVQVTGRQGGFVAHPRRATVAGNLVLLCDRQKQSEDVTAALEDDLQGQHRPVIVLLRGAQNQKPQSFVERVWQDLLPECVGNRYPCHRNKIRHDIDSATVDLTLARFQSDWIRALRESAVFAASGSSSLPKLLLEDAVQRINDVGAVVIQTTIFLTPDAGRTRGLVKRLLEFYTQPAFRGLQNPLVVGVCLMPVSSSPQTSMFSRLFSFRSKHVDLENLNFADLIGPLSEQVRIVSTDLLGDVRQEDVIRWSEHSHVMEYCPDLPRRPFSRLIFEPWEKKFHKPCAPMENAIEDLEKLIADCCLPSGETVDGDV